MVPDLIRIITEHGVMQVFPLLIITLLRPLGMLFSFTPFFWAFGSGSMLRTCIAFSIGLPTLAASTADIDAMVGSQDFRQMAIIAPKEIAIGLLLGFLLSLPFWALRYAGAIIASYKGEADGGFENPEGGTVSSVEGLFELIALAAFVYAGGLWLTVTTLYATYDIWPLATMLPEFDINASSTLFDALASTLMITVQTALPILVVLVFIDFTLSVGGRIGRRYQLGDYSFALKNLATAMMLPVIVYIIWLMNADIDLVSASGLDIMRALFK